MSPAVIALVTGANKGLGKETAGQLGRLGMTVLLGARDYARGEIAARELDSEGAKVIPIHLDVTDEASVEAVAAQVSRDHGHLDVLINNAGAIAEVPTAAMTAELMRETFDVNVFGVVAVMHSLLPLLALSRSARIVNVSSTTASLAMTSGGHDFGGNADHRLAYSTSKAALNMLTLHYARLFREDLSLSRIKINSAAPGYVATDMTGNLGTRTVEEGSRIIVHLATLPEDGPSGGFFNDQGPVPW